MVNAKHGRTGYDGVMKRTNLPRSNVAIPIRVLILKKTLFAVDYTTCV